MAVFPHRIISAAAKRITASLEFRSGATWPSSVMNSRRLIYSITSSAMASSDGGTVRPLCGLEVYNHLELGRKLHREIARLRAAQDAIDICGGATKCVYRVDSVGEQAAVSDRLR
jgi:hypothetical protein